MLRSLGLGVLLFGLWFVLSGHTEPLILGFGVFSCAFVVWIASRMDLIDEETVPAHMIPAMWKFIPWLGKEIFQANIDVAKIVLNPAMPIAPSMFRTKPTQTTDVGKAIYANSITLTPGTVTIEIDEGEFIVHALNKAFEDGVQTGEMDRRVSELEAPSS